MATELKLPELGENVESAIVGAVLVSAGDRVALDQPVIEVETDKATAEIPAETAGVVKRVLVRQGDEIKVGQVIVTVEEEEGTAPEKEREDTEETSEPEPTAAQRPETATGPEPAPAPPPREPVAGAELIPASPAVRRLARELGVDIAEVSGSGPGALVSLEDVKDHARGILSSGSRVPAGSGAAVSATPLPDFSEWGEVRREPMSGIRRKTAERVAAAWAEVPHVTQFDRADITELEALRKRREGKLTITAIALKVAAAALKVFPRFNASVDPGRSEIILKSYVHLGVAVDAGHGLLVPVVRDCDRKEVLRIAAEVADLSARARAKKLSMDEMRGATFTVTNLGGLGTTYFAPIVNWPEVAILGLGRAATEAVWRDGAFSPRLVLPLCLSYDHRAIDGADAARFLRWIAEALEEKGSSLDIT